MTDNEILWFDSGYKLGFRAGQAERRRYSMACLQDAEATIAGANIAVTRGNISLEEYTRLVEEKDG